MDDVMYWLQRQEQRKIGHWRVVAEYPDGTRKTFLHEGKEKFDRKAYCQKHEGVKIVSCRKLYPFNMWNNQHNFELVYNVCWNRLWDMDNGEEPYDKEEYDRLWHLKERAGYFETLGCGVVWLPYEEWKEAKELAAGAIMHRQEACIKAGRPDLITYC